jgi:hypothetical protein
MLRRARLLSDRRSDHLLHKHAQGSCSRDGDQNAQQAAERAPGDDRKDYEQRRYLLKVSTYSWMVNFQEVSR